MDFHQKTPIFLLYKHFSLIIYFGFQEFTVYRFLPTQNQNSKVNDEASTILGFDCKEVIIFNDSNEFFLYNAVLSSVRINFFFVRFY